MSTLSQGANVEKDLQANIARWMESANVPATSIAIIQNGKIEAQIFGLANAKTKQEATTETVFQAASVTKPFFAYLIMTLAETGIIDLDKPLSDYLPAPYIPDEPRLSAITARRVLSHTTGFPNWRGKNPLQIYINPGERWSYSGEGYVYLQKVIEHLTQNDCNKLAATYIFEPMKLTRSHLIWIPEAYEGTAAMGHDENGELVEDPPHTEAGAAHSLYATPTDIAKFMLQMFETTSITQAMLTAQVNTNTLVPWDDAWPNGEYRLIEDILWGLGWGLQQIGDETSFWHWGDLGEFHTFAIGNTASKSGVVVMTNGEKGQAVYVPIVEAVMGGKQPATNWIRNVYGV